MDLGVVILASVVAVGAGALVRWRQPVVGVAGRMTQFLTEVRAEVRKVTWPSVQELRKSTGVIIIFIIVIGIIIGIMDWLFSQLLVNWLGRLFG